MKKNTKEFIDLLMMKPKLSATQAYIDTHSTDNRASARSSASKLLASPNIQIYLNEHIQKAKNRILDLVDSEHEPTAFRASESILDRQLGKPRQSHEIISQKVMINIDLSGNSTPH